MQKIFLENSKELREKLNYVKQINTENGPYHLIIPKRGSITSFFISELGVKYINSEATKLVENPLTGKEEKLLSGEYCRLWLKKLYPPFTVPSLYNHLKQSVPNWYCGKYINRELAYFDLVGAYHQIYKRLWLDFQEVGMKCNYPLREIADKLQWWKSARNGLVGNLSSYEVCQIIGKEWKYTPTWSKDKYYNHLILWFSNTILTELANMALKLGCCYIATDGFIFPISERWKDFISVLNRYNLKFRCVIGQGSILKFAAYWVEGEALYGEKTSVSTETYRELKKMLDNPILQNDPRKQILMRKWNLPLKHVTKMNSDYYVSWWSKLK